mmetsp:Transcript_12510/g.30189  ORF Transcript_12510/g.30189 Transcript_12510/m.30189 type:complete len:690 (-) Transcript_12510:3672-5741(-)
MNNNNNNNHPRPRRRRQRRQHQISLLRPRLEDDDDEEANSASATATMTSFTSSSSSSSSASSPYSDDPFNHKNRDNRKNINDEDLSILSDLPTTRTMTSTVVAAGLWKKLRDGFSSLKGSPSELYYAYVLKFLDSYSYFSFSIIFTLFLSEDFHYGDVTSGTLYGSWGALTTIYGLLTGFVIDNIGVSKSLRVGYTLSLMARIGIFLTTSRTILLFHILITLPLGTCLGIPVLTTGIRRYTTTTNRGFAFGLFYVVMNIAALVSGPIVDILSIWYKGDSSSESSDGSQGHNRSLLQKENQSGSFSSSAAAGDDVVVWTLSSYRAIILSGIVSNVIACLVTLSIREIKVQQTASSTSLTSTSASVSAMQTPNNNNNTDLKNNDEDGDSNPPRYQHIRTPTTAIINATPSTTMTTTTTMLGPDVDEPASMAIPPSPGPSTSLRSKNTSNNSNNNNVAAFRPLTGSPTQILRETCRSPSFRRFLLVCLIMLNVRMVFRHLDATLPKYMIREFGPDVPKGTIYAINPALIIVLVPIVTAATSNVEPLVMMHYGSYISAASVFILAFSTSIWACIVFVTVLSVGESIWSPRLYDYSVSVCREGREGTYMALTSAPLFLAKLPVGFLSGLLLQRYCPEDGERNSQVMWLIIGLITATSPVFMTCCWRYISQKPNEDEEPDNVNYTELRTRAPTVV